MNFLQKVNSLTENLDRKDTLVYSSLKKSPKAPLKKKEEKLKSSNSVCSVCNKTVDLNSCVKADGGKTIICRTCFTKLF